MNKKKGDVAEVKNGYAVNFLIPRGMAAVATAETVRNAKEAKIKKQERKEEIVGDIGKLAERVNGKTFQMKVEVSSGGRVYASVGKDEVKESLMKQWKVVGEEIGVEVDLARPIKEIGKYPLDVEISGGDVKKNAEIILEVISE
ncbi:50S ribosomal protein L9 [Candidatus Dojkabacteria bacterium]|nr:50S ribosomal protein L9 [Candidatus Dojkabacteria bacterium]